MAQTSDTLSATGSVTLTKPASDTLTTIGISGTYGTVTLVFEGSADGTNFAPLAAVAKSTGSVVNGTLSPTDDGTFVWDVPSVGLGKIRARVTAIASGSVAIQLHSGAYVGIPPVSVVSSSTFGATTINDDLTLSSGANLVMSGTTGTSDLVLTDNLADALSVKIAGGNDLIVLRTTNSDEAVQFPNAVEHFGDSGTKKVISVSTTSIAETVTSATGEYETRLTDNLADAWSVKVVSGADVAVVTTTDTAESFQALGFRNLQTTAVGITGATTLTLADSGGIWTIDQDAAFDIDLPSPTSGAGCSYTFVVTDAGANNVTITVADSAATFVGTIVNDVTSVLPCTGSTITFATGVTAVGDWVRVRSLATNLYFVEAVTSANGGITIA